MLTDIKTRYGNYKVDFLSTDTYIHDGSPAITAWSRTEGPIAIITVCLEGSRLEPNQSYVDTNNCPWAPEWIEENDLGRNTGKRARSGYCTYPLYEFDMARIKEEGGTSMKRIMAIILALVLLTTPVTAQVCDLTKAKTEMTAKTGIYEYKGHWYLYIGGKMQYGKIRYKGNYYYAHKTGSKAYPRGSLTKGQFRIEGKNKWYAYSINYGRMYLKNTYVRKGRFRKCIDLEIRKDHTVKYVYNNASTVRGSIRYSTAERRLQRDEGFGDWHTVEGMQFIPDNWVDFQK